MTSIALRVVDVHKRFGGVPAAIGATFDVGSGTVHALIGPNGAGKTTLINVMSGYVSPDSGRIQLFGDEIGRLPVAARVKKGLARTFQIRQLFGGMTAFENVLMGCHLRIGAMPWRPRFKGSRRERTPRDLTKECDALLSLTGIERFRNVPAAHLPAGIQGRLEVARALATQPSVLLLDEPCAGLAADEAHEIGVLLKQLARPEPSDRRNAIAVLVVEHNVPFVLQVADRITVMDAGEVIASGSAADVRRDPRVIKAYLGGGEGAGASH